MSQHQKHCRIKVLGTINMPLLHNCMMIHFIDLVTYHFPLQMLYLYWVHAQASRISPVIWYLFPSSPLSGRLQSDLSVSKIYFYLSALMASPYAPNINSCFPVIHLIGIKILISTTLEEMRWNECYLWFPLYTEEKQGTKRGGWHLPKGRVLQGQSCRAAGAGARAPSAALSPPALQSCKLPAQLHANNSPTSTHRSKPLLLLSVRIWSVFEHRLVVFVQIKRTFK